MECGGCGWADGGRCPFGWRAAEGELAGLSSGAARAGALDEQRQGLETLPWFKPGKPLRNYMLHETDFYDEVEQVWGRRWGAEGIGTLRDRWLVVPRLMSEETVHGWPTAGVTSAVLFVWSILLIAAVMTLVFFRCLRCAITACRGSIEPAATSGRKGW